MPSTSIPLAESITLTHKGSFTIVDSDMRQGKGDFTLSEDGNSIYTVRYAQNSDQGEPYKLFRAAKYDLPESFIVPEDFDSIPTTLDRTDIGLDMLGESEGVGQNPVIRTFEYADPDITNGFFIILGLHEKSGKLIVNNNIYYAANGLRPQTTFVFDSSNLNAAETAQDPTLTVEDDFSMRDIGKMLGNMSNVPSDWQSFFGGEIFSGSNQSSITTNWSAGPSLLAFSTSELVTTSDPDDLVSFGSEPVMYYPDESNGPDGTPQALYNRSVFTPEEIAHINITDSFLTDVLGTNTAIELLSGGVAKNEWWNDQSRVITQFIVPGTRTLAVLTNTLGTTREPYYKNAPTQPYEYQKEYNGGITTAVLDENGKPVPELDENGQVQPVQKGLIYKAQSWIYDEDLGDYTLTPPSGGGSAAIRDDKYLSVLLFDTLDLQKVKDGELLGYQVQPYKQQLFKQPLPFTTGDKIHAVPQCGDFKDSTGELYLSYKNEYQFSASSYYPLFNAFDVSATTRKEDSNMSFNEWGTFNQWSVPQPTLPIVDAGQNSTANVGDTVALSTATASNFDSLLWSCTSGQNPTFSNVSALNPSVLFNEPGTYILRLTATNADGSTSDEVEFTINEEVLVNQPPTANAGADQTVEAGATVTLDGTGSTDGDGTIASYAWSQSVGDVVTLTGDATATPTFDAPTTPQNLEFTLVVTDNLGLNSEVSTVSVFVEGVVLPPGIPPVADAGLNKIVSSNDEVTLDGSNSEQGSVSIVSYSWSQLLGTPVIIQDASKAVAKVVIPDIQEAETMAFELVVTDSAGLTSSKIVKLQVAAQRPFFINATRDYSTVSGDGTWRGKIRQGEVDSFTLTIDPAWISPENIVSYTIVNPDEVDIIYHSRQENIIQVYLTSEIVGKHVIRFDYETPSRSDRVLVTLTVST